VWDKKLFPLLFFIICLLKEKRREEEERRGEEEERRGEEEFAETIGEERSLFKPQTTEEGC
jgi:hypothetical protein